MEVDLKISCMKADPALAAPIPEAATQDECQNSSNAAGMMDANEGGDDGTATRHRDEAAAFEVYRNHHRHLPSSPVQCSPVQ